MDNVNLIISAFVGASITLIVGESVKWYKEQRRWQKKRFVLLNYFIKILKPGFEKYKKDLHQAINEIDSYPPHTNVIPSPVYDVLPWFNSDFLKSQEINELFEITDDPEFHADLVMMPYILNYLKDYSPSGTISEFHQSCSKHYEDKGIKGYDYLEHASGCLVISQYKTMSIKNLKGREQPLKTCMEWVDKTIDHLQLVMHKKRFFTRIDHRKLYEQNSEKI
jgi:hypothetical protein